MIFEIVRSRRRLRQRWHWRIRADNGRILASSETYRDRGDCLAAIRRVQAEAAAAPIHYP